MIADGDFHVALGRIWSGKGSIHMKVNIISILIVVVFTYILVQNILIASQAGIILIVLFGFIEYFQGLFQGKNKKKKTKKEQVERGIMFSLLLVCSLFFVLSYTPYAKTYSSIYHMTRAYKEMPTNLIIKAIDDIKKHPNKMQYCALLLFPSLEKDSKAAIAKRLAFYYVGEKYCNQFGPWSQNNCQYLKSMNYSGYPIALMKNLKLCEISKTAAFQDRIARGGYQDGQ